MDTVTSFGKCYNHEVLQAEKYGQFILLPPWGDLIPEKRKNNSVTALQLLLLSQNQPCSVVSICMAKHIDEPGDENRRKR